MSQLRFTVSIQFSENGVDLEWDDMAKRYPAFTELVEEIMGAMNNSLLQAIDHCGFDVTGASEETK